MKIEQLYTNCLAEAAYYIESKGEVAIIDPMREPEPYIQMAKQRGAKIKYIFETHFHADFVSGHLDLAKLTGATIVYGPTAQMNFDAHVAQDGEEFQLGDLTIKTLHTPGHTMESTTWLLKDKNGNDHSIYSGDTLFIGDVGRPDLAVKSDLSKEDLAGHLYDSIYNKIMPLADDVIVYPGHGAGSACGKNLSKETWSTLGEQKKNNYALNTSGKEDFVTQVLDGIMPPPQYFPKNAVLNKTGYKSLDEIIQTADRALSYTDFNSYAKDALVLDTRSPKEFAQGHIPNALFIGLDGSFASWIGTLVEDLEQPILLVVDEGRGEEAITRMARVGYSGVLGYLEGGMNNYISNGGETIIENEVSAFELAEAYKSSNIQVADVRKPSEFEAEHLENAINQPLDFMLSEELGLDPNQSYYVHCKGGYRSLVAISLLRQKGFSKLINVQGGFDKMLETDMPMTAFQCPSQNK